VQESLNPTRCLTPLPHCLALLPVPRSSAALAIITAAAATSAAAAPCVSHQCSLGTKPRGKVSPGIDMMAV